MKKYIQIILPFILVFALSACGNNAEESMTEGEAAQTVYAYVNGEAVEKAELDYFSGRLRGKILSDYTKKYGITDFSHFWDTEYGGTSPARELEKEALAAAVRAKAELIEMRKRGIYGEISYGAFKAQAIEYNRSRESSPQSAGVLSIDMSSFYSYYISNGELKLMEDGEIAADLDKFVDELVKNAEIVIVNG